MHKVLATEGTKTLGRLPTQNGPVNRHGPQVYCLSWNVVRRNVFLSGSWDDTIKLWDLARPASLATFKEHTYCVYAANWRAFHHCSSCRLWTLLYTFMRQTCWVTSPVWCFFSIPR